MSWRIRNNVLEDPEQEAILHRECANDPELLTALTELLDADKGTACFLDDPALPDALRVILDETGSSATRRHLGSQPMASAMTPDGRLGRPLGAQKNLPPKPVADPCAGESCGYQHSQHLPKPVHRAHDRVVVRHLSQGREARPHP